MLRIVIAGSRFFNDYKTLEKVTIKKLFELNKMYPQLNLLTIDRENNLYKINRENLEIISGMASGADSLAVQFANNYSLKLVEFPADWDTYGRRAGYIRNRAMHEYISTHVNRGVIAFWDGKSRGTSQSFSLAESYSNPLRVVHVSAI